MADAPAGTARRVTDYPSHPDASANDTAAVAPRIRVRLRSRTRISSGSPFEPTIGFSRAVRVGNRVLVSGTTPVFPGGSCPDDVALQARRCFAIIEAALAEAGASFTDVVRTRMFLIDPADADAVGAVHGEILGDVRPAATMVAVSALLDPRWKIEIEAEAVLARRRFRMLGTIATRRTGRAGTTPA
jgi:enamine deaminase RidA (YjgF/YER057c/UK114 family)